MRDVGKAVVLATRTRCAPCGRHEERHEAQRHGQDHPPVGTAPSNPSAQSFGGLGPSTNHGPTIRTRHAVRTGAVRRRGAAGRGPVGRRGRAAVPSGQGGQLGDGVPQHVVRVEHLDLVGPHRLRGAGRSGSGPAPRGRSPSRRTTRWRNPGLEGRSAPALVLGTEELAAEAATDGREKVEDGIGPVLPGPFLDDQPRRREQLAEELLSVLPVPALPPAQLPGHRHEARTRTCSNIRHTKGSVPASRSRTRTRRAASSRSAAPRGAPHVFDHVTRGRTRWRTRPGPEDQTRQARIPSGHILERGGQHCGSGRAIRHSAVIWSMTATRRRDGAVDAAWHRATVRLEPPPIAPPGAEHAHAAARAADPPGRR